MAFLRADLPCVAYPCWLGTWRVFPRALGHISPQMLEFTVFLQTPVGFPGQWVDVAKLGTLVYHVAGIYFWHVWTFLYN